MRVDDKIEKKVKANEIQVGDQLILYKNQTVPADGILLSQQAFFDNSLITGESDSVEQVVSSKVYGGARCLSDKIFIEVTSDQSESRMSHILDQLDVALNRDSSITELTDSVAHYFTYGLFTTGLIFFTTYSFVDFDEAINRVLALFVIACPCALAVTTPIVLRLAAKKSFKHNFLIKRADVFEKLNQCQAVVFDKTGTLTYSQSEVLAWTPRRPSAFEEQIIYSLEQNSSHPLANAIIASLEGTQIKPLSLKNFAETAGLGVEGFYKGDCYSLRSYDHEHGDVGFFKNNQLTLSIRTQTHIRSEVTEEVQQLQGMNLDVYLLTGDNIEKAINLANQAGIHKKNIIAGIDPEGKSDFIKKLSQHKAVVYVGDGLNDSLAMAQGLVGISMNQSVEATFAASSIHILKDGVSGIGKLLKQGKFTLKTIRSLLLISFIYNITFGVLALTGFVTPLLASILMPINSLALLSFAVARGRRL